MSRVLRNWPWFAAAISAAMIGIAHAFETFGKLAPCHLCLQQREVYWTALAVSIMALGMEVVTSCVAKQPNSALALQWVALRRAADPVAGKISQPMALLLACIFLFGASLAAFHAGVEWKWWPGPTTCTAGNNSQATLASLNKLLRGDAESAPLCDKAAWVMLGLSMAGWNAVLSLGLSGLSLAAALGKGHRP